MANNMDLNCVLRWLPLVAFWWVPCSNGNLGLKTTSEPYRKFEIISLNKLILYQHLRLTTVSARNTLKIVPSVFGQNSISFSQVEQNLNLSYESAYKHEEIF